MGKKPRSRSGELYAIDCYHKGLSVRPLFGLERLIKIQRRKQSGVLICDTLTTVSDTITVAKSNRRTAPFALGFEVSELGFMSEPRTSVSNEASAEEIREFQDFGRRFCFTFAPQSGKMYSVECDIYRPLESYHGGMSFRLAGDLHVSTFLLTLDLSGYLKTGFLIETLMCEFQPEPASGKSGKAQKPAPARRLDAAPSGEGCFEWRVERFDRGGTTRVAWMVETGPHAQYFPQLNVERLALELSVNPSLAKDLHNFVSLCQFYAAGFRSLTAIDGSLVVSKTALWRSLDLIEQMVGAELIQRTRGKGLINITPAGEAVLEWWSRYYMRWTPLSFGPIGSPASAAAAARRG